MTAKRGNLWIVLGIVAMVIAGLLLFLPRMESFLNETSPETIKVRKSYQDSLISNYNVLVGQVNDCRNNLYNADSINTDMEDSIAALNHKNDSITALLQKCQGIKKPAVKKTAVQKKTTSKPAVRSTASADLVSRNAFKPSTEGFKATSTYKTSLDGIKVIGLKDGDFYITISPDNYLQYCFAKKLYDEAGGTSAPELNGKNSGKKFELEGDMYVYTDKSAPVTTATLARTLNWTVYIGSKDGYEAYIPHELIKPQISQARGDLAGTISPEDVDKIGALVPEVKAGRIMPNKITATGDYDGLKYEGWHFRTPILYKQQ